MLTYADVCRYEASLLLNALARTRSAHLRQQRDQQVLVYEALSY
jgi:hypothetical protein